MLKTGIRHGLKRVFEGIDRVFDHAFTPASNPLNRLGAMGWFFYWIVVVSGIYLYIFFDTGITRAYHSIELLTYQQWYLGGVMRSLHRYASDALVIIVLLHMTREFVLDRFRGVRWFAWVTGVALLWFIYASGISGYWLVWDQLAQYVAITTTEWFDSLPFFGKPVARNFINELSLSGRFFTLMIFIHIAAPLFLLFGMWIHIQRHAGPEVNPPRRLAAGTLGMLLVLSFLYPAVSHEPANLDTVPGNLNLDWFYLAIYPLIDHYPGMLIWAILVGTTIILMLLPWLPPRANQPVAVVDLDNCNGCGRCAADCPYSAITMSARSDGLPFEHEAVVNPDLCISCGICAGACPTSTPFRRRTALQPGIELPDHRIASLTQTINDQAALLTGVDRVIVFGCGPGTAIMQDQLSNAALVTLPCVGMLPPSMIDYILSRKLADGVILSGCREQDCYYRLGIQWTRQRVARQRDPFLRDRVPRERLLQVWSGTSGSSRLLREIERLQESLARLTQMNPDNLERPRDKQGDLADV